MDKPISAGDLVVVVKPTPCCGSTRAIGRHFIVLNVRMAGSRYHCAVCDINWPEELTALDKKYSFQLWRLKRIPPLSELEGQRSEDEMNIFDFLDV